MPQTSLSPPLPPPTPMFDAQKFRQRLADLTDPSARLESRVSSAEFKEPAKALCVVLAMLYGRSLDRMKIWDRIDSALLSASAKIQDGDTDRLITLCLEHVKAESIVCLPMEPFVRMLESRPLEWREGFVRYLGLNHHAVVIHGRLAWEGVKARNLLRVEMYGEIVEFRSADVLAAEQAAKLAEDMATLDAASGGEKEVQS